MALKNLANPVTWNWVQWLNFVAFALTTLTGAAWWQVYVSASTAALIAGATAWLLGVINFLINAANGVDNTTPTA